MKKIILILALIFSCGLTAQTKIYEIQNKGKGVISELTPANLLLIKDDSAKIAIYNVTGLGDALDLKENSANKQNSLAVDGTNTKYPTVTAVNTGLDLKANDSDVVHKSGNETITGVKSFQGDVPEIKLVETTNNNSVSLRSNSLGSASFGFYGKTEKKLFSFVPGVSGEAKMVIGDVDFPNDSQLLVYGGGGGANIDARGSNSADESNLDLENSDWLTNPKSIGLSTFGDNFNLGGDILGYERKKSSVLRFSNDKSFITSLAPIKLGINNLEIGNINSTGIEAISFTKSSAPATNILLAGGGDISQASLPISTATQTVLGLKANLASPSLTGTPTAPTATAGANTTQIATTAFVKSAISTADSGNVKLTGNQTISGQKSFSLTGKIDMQTNNVFPAIRVTTLGSNGGSAAEFINSSSSPYSAALNLQTGTSGGVGNRSLDVLNQSPIGTGIFSNASNGGVSISSQSGNGDSYISNITSGGTGRNYVGRNNGTETFSVDKIGNVIGNSYIKKSTPTTNILLAGGGDIAQNTAFNKNFGTTAGTVVEGGTLGSNAYTSTAYLPTSSNIAGTLGAINVYGTSGVNGYLGVINLKNGIGAKEWRLSTGIETVTQEGFGIKNVTDNNHPIWILNDGNVGIGTTTPTAKLDVNGTFKATGEATFSSTVTASPATLSNHVVVKSQLDAVVARPYKVYTALLNQSGTNAPVATVLENTLGGAVVWTRESTGKYIGTLSEAFVAGKTFFMSSAGTSIYLTRGVRVNNNNVSISAFQYAATATDGGMADCSIEIRVYN